MSINKNDCMDCANSINPSLIKNDWICTKGNVIPKNKDNVVEVLNEDCKDFDYPE